VINCDGGPELIKLISHVSYFILYTSFIFILYVVFGYYSAIHITSYYNATDFTYFELFSLSCRACILCSLPAVSLVIMVYLNGHDANFTFGHKVVDRISHFC